MAYSFDSYGFINTEAGVLEFIRNHYEGRNFDKAKALKTISFERIDGLLYCNSYGNISLSQLHFDSLPVRFGEVYEFGLYSCGVFSLEGSPRYCTNLTYSRCDNITSLHGSTQNVEGTFSCKDNTNLIVLEGGPIYAKTILISYCDSLVTLEHNIQHDQRYPDPSYTFGYSHNLMTKHEKFLSNMPMRVSLYRDWLLKESPNKKYSLEWLSDVDYDLYIPVTKELLSRGECVELFSDDVQRIVAAELNKNHRL